MNIVSTKKDHRVPVFPIRGAVKRPPIGYTSFSALASVLLASSVISAHPAVDIELSQMVAKSTLLSPVDPTAEINVVLSLPLGDAKAAAEFVKHVSKATDPLYRHYLTPQEFANRFGANAADYTGLKEWAHRNGLTVSHESVARTTLTVRGKVAQFQNLFNTQLNNYRSPDGDEFYSAGIKPTVPSGIVFKVDAVIGLNESVRYARHAKIHKVFGVNPSTTRSETDGGTGSGPGGSYKAQDLRLAYYIPSFGGGVPQTVGVFEQGGFPLSDVQAYIKDNNLPNVPIGAVSVDGYPTNIVGNDGVQLEAALDVDMIIGINPGVRKVLVFEDGSDPFSVALLDTLYEVGDNFQVSILSISYGSDEVQQSVGIINMENTVLTQLAAEGITVLASSGDRGAYGTTGTLVSLGTLNVNDPSAQPLVTSVGGTKMSTGAQESFNGEVVWNDLSIDEGATGGGVSSYWPIPSWQTIAHADYNGGSITNRNLPDVAAVGDPLTGVAVYSAVNGGWLEVGGTSVATPIWAGYLSILDSGLEYLNSEHLGFFNPTLYDLMFYPIPQLIRTPPTVGRRGCLYDVSTGNNGEAALYGGIPGYTAGTHYDNCSGTGSLGASGGGFAFQILAPYWLGSLGSPAEVTGLNAKQVGATLELSWAPDAGATGYVIGMFYGGQPPPQPFPQKLPNGGKCYVTKATTKLVDGVAANTSYYIMVSAVNKSGASRPVYIPFTTN
jgi:subtilase family serine protease